MAILLLMSRLTACLRMARTGETEGPPPGWPAIFANPGRKLC